MKFLGSLREDNNKTLMSSHMTSTQRKDGLVITTDLFSIFFLGYLKTLFQYRDYIGSDGRCHMNDEL